VKSEVCEDAKSVCVRECMRACLQGNMAFVCESQVCQIVGGQCCGDAGTLQNEALEILQGEQ